MVAESSAWAARMRFALADTAPIAAVTPAFKTVDIRVRPRRGPPAKT